MAGSLRGPRAKVERAKKHVQELQAVLGAEFATISHTTHPDVIVRQEDPDSQQLIYKLGRELMVPDSIATIAGDVIHNLRCALDLLITQLIMNAGHNPAGEYFPISDTRKKFVARCKAEIQRRVGQDAFDLIQASEAHCGGKGDTLWRIHRLDIEDKHRLLLLFGVVMRSQTVPFPIPDNIPAGMRDLFSETLSEIFIREVFFIPADRPMLKEGDVLYSCPLNTEDEPQFRIEIAFGESDIVQSEPLLPTLVQYAQFVESTLDGFGAILPPQ